MKWTTYQDDDGVDNVVLDGVPPGPKGALCLGQAKGGKQRRAQRCHRRLDGVRTEYLRIEYL